MDRPLARRTRRLGRTARTATVAAAALLALSALASCRPDQVGTAANVAGERISVDELQDATASYLEAVPTGDESSAQQAILQQLIVSAVIEKAAATADVDVTDSEVAAQRDEVLDSVREPAEAEGVSARVYLVRQLAQSQQGAVVPPERLEEFIRDQLLASRIAGNDPALTNQALVEAAEQTDVEVNPRYGRWDPQQGLAPLVSGGLSSTVEELTQSDQQ
jgi:SurA N-terminal domain